MDIQRKIYDTYEKPRLQALIKREIQKAGGNASQGLIPLMNSRLEGTGLHSWTSTQLTGLTADSGSSSFTTKKLLRVAISLDIHPEPRWALAMLYLYMLGFLDLEDRAACENLQSLLCPQSDQKAAELIEAIEAIEDKNPGATTQLLIHSPLTKARLDQIRDGADLTDDERRWIPEWAAQYNH
ncbi:hypothetical protein Lepto7375DRAFT_7427 [Leptolyngbya sp. PCC 7375]|nr:hypothetical protein Lepto7375DRAFT_7427 [Leptolyngbya sp. PCC 7375]